MKGEKKLKKLTAVFLVLILITCLAACVGKTPESGGGSSSAGKEEAKIENKIDLSVDKTVYEKEERIEVTLDFSKLNQDSAVIAIVQSNTPHGSSESIREEGANEEYRYLSDFSELPFYMWAPNKDGVFDIRVFSAEEGGKELGCVSFAVGSAVLPTEDVTPPQDPPTDGKAVKKAFFNPPKSIYMDVTEGGSRTSSGSYSFALLDGNYSYTLNSDGVFFHTSAETRTHYCPYGDGWAIDNSDGCEYGGVPDEELIYELCAYLDTFYEDAESYSYANNIAKYYVGTETVAYRDCYVYEIKDDGYGVYKKFWVDPENGATLKYIEREGDETVYEFEVTQYNLLGPVWSNTLRPDYGSSMQTLF